jgi:hypothetical protein
LYFTAVITLEAQGARTKYAALAMHGNESRSKKHQEPGFYQGWGTAFDQLVSVAKGSERGINGHCWALSWNIKWRAIRESKKAIMQFADPEFQS